MKKILTFAVVVFAVCAVFAKSKHMSKAEIEKQDKANWGLVDYSAAPDGENSAANDLAQIKSMVSGETAKMKKLYDLCKSLIFGAKVVDVEPETILGDALQQLGRPIDPTPPRTHSNLSATPAQKLGFKSLQVTKRTLANFGKDVRPKMSVLLKTEIETRIFSNYNRLARVTTFPHIKDGSLVESFKNVDKAWGKYLKLLDKIANGTDKWKYYPSQLSNPETKKKLFADLLKESGLDTVIEADGRLAAKSSRYFNMLDGYFKRCTDDELKKFEDAIDRCWKAHDTAANALNAFSKWFGENGMSHAPGPREFIKELLLAHGDYVHKNCDLLEDCKKVLSELRNESLPVGKLRKCKGFSPNKALFVRSGPVSERPPSYVRRMNELAREAKKRFGDAVEKRINTAGRIQI